MCRPQFKNLWFLRLRHMECACYYKTKKKKVDTPNQLARCLDFLLFGTSQNEKTKLNAALQFANHFLSFCLDFVRLR